jgi:hypothetical protein
MAFNAVSLVENCSLLQGTITPVYRVIDSAKPWLLTAALPWPTSLIRFVRDFPPFGLA